MGEVITEFKKGRGVQNDLIVIGLKNLVYTQRASGDNLLWKPPTG